MCNRLTRSDLLQEFIQRSITKFCNAPKHLWSFSNPFPDSCWYFICHQQQLLFIAIEGISKPVD